MSKAIYDLLNVVDRYIELTKFVCSEKLTSWDEIVEIQKNVKIILISSDLKSTLQDQILNSKERSYQKLLELFLNSRNELENLIDHLKINPTVFVFDPILTLKDKWFQDLIDIQDKRLKIFDKEYKELNKKLEWGGYGISVEDWKIAEKNIEKELKNIEPFLKDERGKLAHLYADQRKFIHENSQYTVSYHVELLDYMDSILKNSFNRNKKITKKEKINELIDFVKEYFETNTILNKEQNILLSRLVEEIKTAFQNQNNERIAEKIAELTDKIKGYGGINAALYSQIQKITDLLLEKDSDIDKSVELFTNKLDDIYKNQCKIKESIKSERTSGLIYIEQFYFDKSVLDSVFELFESELFENLNQDEFKYVFQGNSASVKYKLKKNSLNKIYFSLKYLSYLIREGEKREAWLKHIVTFIDWDLNFDNLKRLFSQKGKDANFEFKSKLVCLIPIPFVESFKLSELKKLNRRFKNGELNVINGYKLDSIIQEIDSNISNRFSNKINQ